MLMASIDTEMEPLMGMFEEQGNHNHIITSLNNVIISLKVRNLTEVVIYRSSSK